ncbi:MAG: hypothetical protein NVSMB70_06200 [Chamaesiphon sp.]
MTVSESIGKYEVALTIVNFLSFELIEITIDIIFQQDYSVF